MTTTAGDSPQPTAPRLRADEADRWRIADGIDLVFIGDNEALVQYGTRSRPAELLRDTDLTGVLRRVLHALRGHAVRYVDLMQHFAQEERSEVEELLSALIAKGIVTNAALDPVEQYLGYTVESRGSLADSRVAIIGSGPLGARIGFSLIQHGVGSMTFLDERPADHLWNAFLPFPRWDRSSNDGMAHEAVCKLLRGTGNAELTAVGGGFGAAAIDTAVSAASFAVLATEQPHPRLAHLVNRACLRNCRPWLSVGMDGNIGLAGPLFVPPDTACYNDYEMLGRATTSNPAMDGLYHRFLLHRGSGSFFPGLPAYVDIVAGFGALAAVQYLIGGSSMAVARLIAIDFDEMRVDVEDVLKLPRCPVCGGGRVPAEPPFPPAARADL